MTFKSIAFLALLTWGTALILVRRWAWGQVPTQVPAYIVYATVLLNAFLIARELKLAARRGFGRGRPVTRPQLLE
jgi:TRAP-type C4-dicarboxylate transport system permease small subunit